MPAKTETEFATVENAVLIPVANIEFSTELIGREEVGKVDDLEATIKERGVESPIKVRPFGDPSNQKFQIIFGHRRFTAFKNLVEANEIMDGIPAIIEYGVEDEEAFISNIHENQRRRNTTAADDLHNLKIFRDKFGKSPTEIASIYGRTPAWVSQIFALEALPPRELKLVRDGKISLSSAVQLARLKKSVEAGKVDEDSYKNAVKEVQSKASEGNVSGSEFRAAARKATENAATDESGNKPVVVSRSVKEIRLSFDEIAGDQTLPKNTREVFKSLLDFVNGKIKDTTLLRRINNMLPDEAPAETAEEEQ